MAQYIVSALKYRPANFSTVVGQAALTSTLKNAIASDRLAHAYLFCGSRGVGKTSCARIFAKTINCTNRTPDGEACNECESCRSFNENRSLNIIELDAASHNGIDDMKALMEQVLIPPTRGRYRVFIIDEVHMLSTAAFNAFLKTLEEPPAYVIFILATTEKHKIIPTILSRCQIYDFNRITINDIIAHLADVARKEGITAETAALNVIARQADGAMRDALSIFDQVAASSRGNITYASTIENLNVLDSSYYSRLLDAILARDIPAALLVYHDVRQKGFDSQFFLNGLAQYLRDLMMASDPSTIALVEASDEVRSAMAAEAAKFVPAFMYGAMALCNDADLNYRQASNKQLLVELTIIRIAQLLTPSPVQSGRGGGAEPLKPVASAASGQAAPSPGHSRSLNPHDAPPAAPSPQQPAPMAVSEPHAPYGNNPVPSRSAPAAPAPSRSAGRSAAVLRPGVAIHGAAPQKSRPSSPPGHSAAAPVSVRNTPFTPDDLLRCWDTIINSHPTEHLLINTMRACPPRAGADPHLYTVTVESNLQAELMRDKMPHLLAALRDELANDNLKIEVALSQSGPSPALWNEHQVLEHMLATAPPLADFIRDLKLTPL